MLNTCMPEIVNKLKCYFSIIYKENDEVVYVTPHITDNSKYEDIITQLSHINPSSF